MNLKVIAIILAVLAVALVGYWAANGAELFTLEQIQVTEIDPLFGTESKVWKDAFRPGLLDLVGPVAGGLAVGSAILFWLAARRRRAVAA